MSLAFVFPGQGSQSIGMLAEHALRLVDGGDEVAGGEFGDEPGVTSGVHLPFLEVDHHGE